MRHLRRIKWRLFLPYFSVAIFCLLILIFANIIWNIAPDWSGFGNKTFWNLLELLIVPIALALLAIWFNHQSQKNSRELLNEQFQENSYQKYFDFIFETLIKKSLSSSDEDNDLYRTIIWQRTVAISQILGERRKKVLLDFLYYTDMIYNNQSNINLFDVDLSNIEYSNSYLTNTNLRGVNFENTNLRSTRLREADLNQANLKNSILDNCDLIGANLVEANLTKSSFQNAEMMLVNLKNATVSEDQLKTAKNLLGAIMPDGSRYDGRFLLKDDIETARNLDVDTENQIVFNSWCRTAREIISDHMDIDLKISNKYDHQ